MKNLMETYKKKMKSAQNLLTQLNGPDDSDARIRITSQINCYNYFIFELERLLLTSRREKQRVDTQSILIREITEFNRQMGKSDANSTMPKGNSDDKKLKLFSN